VACTQVQTRLEPEALPTAEWWLQGQEYFVAMAHQISDQMAAFAATVSAGADQLLAESSGATLDWARLLSFKFKWEASREASSDYEVSPPPSMLWASTLLAFVSLLVATTTSSRGRQEPSGEAVESKLPASKLPEAAPAHDAAQLIRQMANEPMTPANPTEANDGTETAETAPPPPSATPSEDGRALLESAVTDGLEGLQPLVLFDLKPSTTSRNIAEHMPTPPARRSRRLQQQHDK
jgi:hypothetical protein